jgi:hypothetical protein
LRSGGSGAGWLVAELSTDAGVRTWLAAIEADAHAVAGDDSGLGVP